MIEISVEKQRCEMCMGHGSGVEVWMKTAEAEAVRGGAWKIRMLVEAGRSRLEVGDTFACGVSRII